MLMIQRSAAMEEVKMIYRTKLILMAMAFAVVSISAVGSANAGACIKSSGAAGSNFNKPVKAKNYALKAKKRTKRKKRTQ